METTFAVLKTLIYDEGLFFYIYYCIVTFHASLVEIRTNQTDLIHKPGPLVTTPLLQGILAQNKQKSQFLNHYILS